MKKDRRHDLDWLRVLAIILLLFFHSGMVFISWSWYFMQDSQTSWVLNEFTLFLSHWRMALLFMISGAGTLFALGYRSGGKYIKERSFKLLIPLTFGILIIIPPQIYYELVNHGREFSNYFEFKYEYLKGGLYPLGDFSWHHLWFIGYLFLYSCLALPIFLFLRSAKGKKIITKAANIFTRKGVIYLLVIPLIIVQILLRNKFSGFHNLVDDMANFSLFFLFFIYGFIICSNQSLWDAIEKQRSLSLLLGVISFSILQMDKYYLSGVLGYYGYWIVESCVAWFLVLAILGYGKRYLNFRTKFLNYANEGIYPFYILHQTILVILAYYIIRWETTILVKYSVLSIATLIICILIYDIVVKRNNVTRFLFGMKRLKRPQTETLNNKRQVYTKANLNIT